MSDDRCLKLELRVDPEVSALMESGWKLELTDSAPPYSASPQTVTLSAPSPSLAQR